MVKMVNSIQALVLHKILTLDRFPNKEILQRTGGITGLLNLIKEENPPGLGISSGMRTYWGKTSGDSLR